MPLTIGNLTSLNRRPDVGVRHNADTTGALAVKSGNSIFNSNPGSETSGAMASIFSSGSSTASSGSSGCSCSSSSGSSGTIA